jgi:hypothetical protein
MRAVVMDMKANRREKRDRSTGSKQKRKESAYRLLAHFGFWVNAIYSFRA